MGLAHLPNLTSRAAEIDDALLLVNRLLFREGEMWMLLHGDLGRPREERDRALRALLDSNRADLNRLAELADN